jgi:hypothetical protein
MLGVTVNVHVDSSGRIAKKHPRQRYSPILRYCFVNAKLTGTTNFYLPDRNFAPN